MFPGTTHDKKVYDRTRVVTPPGETRAGDTALILARRRARRRPAS